MHIARVDIAERWTSRNLTMRHYIARVDNARPENGARSNRGVRAKRSRVVVYGYLCWVGIKKPPVNNSNKVLFSAVHQRLVQSTSISASDAAFRRRTHGYSASTERQQQQRGRRRRDQSGARASSDDVSGVRLSSGSSCSNIRRQQLWSLPRGATTDCFLLLYVITAFTVFIIYACCTSIVCCFYPD